MTINQQTQDFIILHKDDDVRKVALMYKADTGVDLPFALNQIAGRQVAKTKLPSWYEAECVIYPPHISMEQCSSEQTACYKEEVLQRVLRNAIKDEEDAKNCHFIDFTGGFGVDFSYMARHFGSSTYIERQSHLCDIARHNFPLLGLKQAEVLCKDSEEAMQSIRDFRPEKHLIAFMDPARRDVNGQRTYAIADCTPNVVHFIGKLLDRCEIVMLKLSPMLDWHNTVKELNNATSSRNAVREVHIVSSANECKELLVVLSEKYVSPLSLHCINDDTRFVIRDILEDNPKEKEGCSIENNISKETPDTEKSITYLLVPNASVMKAGCFEQIEDAFEIKQISINSHLFLSNHSVIDFPGRQFIVLSVTTMNKKELRKALNGIDKANISTRNFPISPENLRKKLKLKDGGKTYIFATTTAHNEHVLYVCEKT